MFDIIIIGAGPAGMMAAISAASESHSQDKKLSLALFEANPHPGRKLLLSGNGQCNITNTDDHEEFLAHYGSRKQGRFLRHAFYAFDNLAVRAFLHDLHLSTVARPDGKVFPASYAATDVLEVMTDAMERLGVELFMRSRVVSVSFDTGRTFSVSAVSGNGTMHSHAATALIIATGGSSYAGTGSTGDGYRFAKELGHRIVPTRPALCGISIGGYPLAHLTGVSLESVTMGVWRRGRKVVSYRGDLLFTHTGFSGPVVMNNSRDLQRGDEVTFDFSGMGSECRPFITGYCGDHAGSRIVSLLKHLGLPRSLSLALLEIAELSPEQHCGELGRRRAGTLCSILTDYRFPVASAGKYSSAMVTAGGVALDEVDPASMASRVTAGLYFAGEVLDIDGDTGGYNIQAALSTGAAAGRAAAAYCRAADSRR